MKHYGQTRAAGRRIAQARRRLHLSAAVVALRAGCSANGLAQLESGARFYVSDAYLASIGRVLGLSVEQLRGHAPMGPPAFHTRAPIAAPDRPNTLTQHGANAVAGPVSLCTAVTRVGAEAS